MENSKEHLAELFAKEIFILQRANRNLELSLNRARELDLTQELTFQNLEVLDSFASKFMRAYEVLVNQVLRTALLLMDEKLDTRRDNLNQAEKFLFITSYSQIDRIRILRNKVAHEYLDEEWEEIYTELIKVAPLLMKDIQMTFVQIEKRKLN